MSSHKRDAKKHIKASKRRRLKAQERLARDRRRRNTPLRLSTRPSMTWGFLKTS
jgi:hypothetical protein